MKHTKSAIANFSICLLLALVLPSCISGEPGNKNSENEIEFSGVVKYVDIEGGFWGIITDENKKYEPVNLGEKFREDGLKVKGILQIIEDSATIRMWGQPAELLEISRENR